MEASTSPPSASGSAYSHEPLDPSKRQIRLARLKGLDKVADQQATASDTPSLEITIFDLDTAPEYSALSYMWGDKHFTCPIFLNGHEYMISPNLHAFLLWMVTHKVDSWIWIDQLSINQDSITERNHQVSMMAKIYSQASEVIIWLSEGPSGASNPWLRQQAQQPSFDGVLVWWDSSVFWDSSIALRDSLAKLLGNEYWARMWVMQEIFLAGQLFLACDFGICPFSRMSIIPAGMHALVDVEEYSRRFEYGLPFFQRHLGNGTTRDLQTLLMAASYKHCQDPRDMVFALQGIIRPEARLPHIDYSQQTQHVFLEAMGILFQEQALFNLQAIELVQVLYGLGCSMLPGLAGVFEHMNNLRYEPTLLFLLHEVMPHLRQLLRNYPRIFTVDVHVFLEVGVMRACDEVLVPRYIALLQKWNEHCNQLPKAIDATVLNADGEIFDALLPREKQWWRPRF